jgi:hypothetical protein
VNIAFALLVLVVLFGAVVLPLAWAIDIARHPAGRSPAMATAAGVYLGMVCFGLTAGAALGLYVIGAAALT